MEFLKKSWDWLNGKKTYIGLGLYYVVTNFIPEHTLVYQATIIASQILGATGVGHKLIKSKNNKLPSGLRQPKNK